MSIRAGRRLVLCLLAVLGAGLPGWSDGEPIVPTLLRPDAELPDRSLEVDLGERRYDLAEELRQGQQVVAFYTKEVPAWENPLQQKRVEAMAHRIITAARLVGPRQIRLDQPTGPPEELGFTFRLLDTDEINAFSAWGGNLFVTRGMIEFCQSDDELAGILAHEVAHSTYHHLREQVQRIQRYNTQQLLALIAAAFMGLDVSHVAGMVQYVHLALLNGHSVDAEAQADWAGCFYAYRAGFNPVGLITCFERLYRLYRSRPQPVELGAFQTHPWSDERAASLEKQIRALGLPVDRRAVTNAICAGVRLVGEGAEAQAELLLGDQVLVQLVGRQDTPAADRAADAALAINRALARGLRSTDLQVQRREGDYVIRTLTRLSPTDLVVLGEADAALQKQPLEPFARRVYHRFVARCRDEELNRGAL
ncbi:MAG: M48 family metalloprotease [Fimbriimonadaceae bacterium]|nr:M48 family metalloprotease [Fimbriimonadaceae bacterium]